MSKLQSAQCQRVTCRGSFICPIVKDVACKSSEVCLLDTGDMLNPGLLDGGLVEILCVIIHHNIEGYQNVVDPDHAGVLHEY